MRAIIFDKAGRMLALKYSDHYHHPEVDYTWIVPSGGCNTGETLEQALARELMEETGLTLKSSKKVHEHDFIDKHGNHRHGITFRCEAEGTVRLSEEHCEHAWVPMDKIDDINWINEVLPPIIRTAAESGACQK